MRTSPPHEQWLARLDIGAVISTKSKRMVPSVSRFEQGRGHGGVMGGWYCPTVVVVPCCCRRRCSPFVVVPIRRCHHPHSESSLSLSPSSLVVSTRDPPHEQWLVRLGAGAVSSLFALVRSRWPASMVAPAIHPTSSGS
jgi:hypothetical protein